MNYVLSCVSCLHLAIQCSALNVSIGGIDVSIGGIDGWHLVILVPVQAGSS